MDRPQIKAFFAEDVTLQQVHEQYLNQKELFNYAQSLDNYIDYLEDNKLRDTDAHESLSIDNVSDVVIPSENVQFYNIFKMKTAKNKLLKRITAIFDKYDISKTDRSKLHNLIRGVGMLKLRLKNVSK